MGNILKSVLSKIQSKGSGVFKKLYNLPFVGASNKKSLSEWNASSGDANATELPSLQILRDRSRDLERNAPAATGAINTLVNGVIGSGIKFQPSIDREVLKISEEQALEWEAKAYQEFRLWSENNNCDYYRQLNFFGLQRLAFSSMMTSGDVFVLLPHRPRAGMPYDMRVQLIEADRIVNDRDLSDSDKIAGGIKYGADGVRESIFIRTPHPGSMLFGVTELVSKWQEVKFYGERSGKRNVLHLIDIKRIGQSRGIPILTPVIDTLKQISKYTEAELTAAVINALLTIAVTRKPPDSLAGVMAGGGYRVDEQGNPVDANGNPTTWPWERADNWKIGTGEWVDLAPYEDLQVINSARPSNQFDPFFLANIKQIGMALGIPFEVLIKHFSSSYSASRAAMLDARRTFMTMLELFNEQFNQPIYEEFLTEAILKGRLHARGYFTSPSIRHAYSGCYFVPPPIGSIDETKEVKAAHERVLGGYSTWDYETTRLNGMSYKDVLRIQAQERKQAKFYGIDFTKSRVESRGNEEGNNEQQNPE